CIDAGEAADAVLPAIFATDDTWPLYPKPDYPIRKYAEQTLGCFRSRLPQQRLALERYISGNDADGWAYNNLGYVYAESGDERTALRMVLKAVAREPANPLFHYNAGMLYRRRARATAALRHLQAAIDLDRHGTKIQSPYLAAL